MTAAEQLVPCTVCAEPLAAGVVQAHAFLYTATSHDISLDRDDLVEHLEEVILDMGNDRPRDSAVSLAYALTQAAGFPEPEDLQAAVLHRQKHLVADR